MHIDPTSDASMFQESKLYLKDDLFFRCQAIVKQLHCIDIRPVLRSEAN